MRVADCSRLKEEAIVRMMGQVEEGQVLTVFANATPLTYGQLLGGGTFGEVFEVLMPAPHFQCDCADCLAHVPNVAFKRFRTPPEGSSEEDWAIHRNIALREAHNALVLALAGKFPLRGIVRDGEWRVTGILLKRLGMSLSDFMFK